MIYDVAIIGAGPAGFECALRCGEYGLKTVLIEERDAGGTCLNRGCIPTKYYLTHAGQTTDPVQAFAEKNKMVERIRRGAAAALKQKNVDVVAGRARFMSRDSIDVAGRTIEARTFVIATGSRPRSLPGLERCRCVTPEAFIDKPIEHHTYAIVGGGVIGVEYAFLLRMMGCSVTLFEREERILPFADTDISAKMLQYLRKAGVRVHVGHAVSAEDLAVFDETIVSVGRVANTDGLGLDVPGVRMDNGWICTGDDLRTSVESVYACGDVRGKFLYAYTAEQEGALIADTLAGRKRALRQDVVPVCVFSKPAAASVGATAAQLDATGAVYHTLTHNFITNSSSHVYDDKEGFVKLHLDARNHILGVHMISHAAPELIGYFALCMSNGLGIEALRNTLLIHPTLSEILTRL